MNRFTQVTLLLAIIVSVLAACSGVSNLPQALAQPIAIDSPLTTATAQTPGRLIDVTFKTPEEAITYYFDGVAQNEVSKILQACAIHEVGENFNFDFYTERLGYVMPAQSLAPSEYPFYAEINKVYLASQILSKVKFFAYALLSGQEIDGSLQIMEEESIDRFIQDVDPSRLSTMEIEQIVPSNETLMNEARYQEVSAEIAKSYGADESTERVLLFSFEGDYYSMGFTLLRYAETWKIADQVSALANTSVLGVPEITTVEDFEQTFGSH